MSKNNNYYLHDNIANRILTDSEVDAVYETDDAFISIEATFVPQKVMYKKKLDMITI